MTMTLEKDRTALSYAEICAFLYREARLLDDRRWEEWLQCYTEDVEYWMPAWTDDDELTTDPLGQISLIYYSSRQGLEDRVYRLNTARSSASMPAARTCHLTSNIELLADRGSEIDLRYNWHTLSHRMQQTDQFFGTSFVTLDLSAKAPKIRKKKVVLKDDYIHQVIDIYHI